MHICFWISPFKTKKIKPTLKIILVSKKKSFLLQARNSNAAEQKSHLRLSFPQEHKPEHPWLSNRGLVLCIKITTQTTNEHPSNVPLGPTPCSGEYWLLQRKTIKRTKQPSNRGAGLFSLSMLLQLSYPVPPKVFVNWWFYDSVKNCKVRMQGIV